MGAETEKLLSIVPVAGEWECPERRAGDDVGTRGVGLGEDMARSSS